MEKNLEKVRTIGLVAHSGAGKTSLGEAVLYTTKTIDRLGRVDDGSSVLDFEPEELKRHLTINTSFQHYNWKKHTIFFADTPGDENFIADTFSCLQVLDGLVVVVDAVDGVKVQTERVWQAAEQYGIPRLIFINKLDRERADFQKTLTSIQTILKIKTVPFTLPIGMGETLKGVVSLLNNKALEYAGIQGEGKEVPLPADMADEIQTYRESLVEHLAEGDDSLIEKFLEGEELTPEELSIGLRKGVLRGGLFPIFCGSALKNMGIDLLLEAINSALPSPLDRGSRIGQDPKTKAEKKKEPSIETPFAALAFKTLADPYAGRLTIFRIFSGEITADSGFYNVNKGVKERFGQLFALEGKTQKPIPVGYPGNILAVAKLKETETGDTLADEKDPILFPFTSPASTVISYAIEAKNKGEEDKVFSSLSRLMEEDPTIRLDRDSQTKEIILSGMGQVHVEATVEKLKRKFGVEVILKPPKIPYLETFRQPAKGIVYRHKKQTGGRGQFAEVHIDVFPLERGKGFEFQDALVGMNVPRNFVPAVEKGISESMQSGVLAGYPVVDFKVRFYDGKSHEVDSSEMAFKIAASMAFKKAVQQAQPILLEPIVKISVTVPDESMGDVIGDLNSRRGKVLGVDSKGNYQVIQAQVPMAEVARYAPDLTAMTQGRGSFQSEFSHYEEIPAYMSEKVIQEAKAALEE
ncbi:MAG: elongation factor G [Deltaproteobacteria bacterium]|nr:elongation factor G [Deltaproteobacteria bacterium]